MDITSSIYVIEHIMYYYIGYNNPIEYKLYWILNVAYLIYCYHISLGIPESSSTLPFLGYLCETRAIYTSTGTDMCFFPFTYQGQTFYSCSFANNTLLNNNGAPWCATEVRHLGSTLCHR